MNTTKKSTPRHGRALGRAAAAIALAGLLGVTVGTSHADTNNDSFSAYAIFTADSEATVNSLRKLVSAQTRLVYDKATGKLLVFGPAADHELLRNALREIDRAPRNLLLEVRFEEIHRQEGAAGVAKSTTKATQQLLLRSGSEATLQIGETVPRINELLDWGHRHGTLQGDITLRRVSAALVVSATMIGNGPKIEVTLTPQLSGVYSAHGDRLRFTQAATTVTATAGEPLTIASFTQHATFYQMFFAGLLQGQTDTHIAITLRATAN